ncbi:MAG TPA: Ada metal-binding domain-containing protein, partial [Bacteroidota bacterium]
MPPAPEMERAYRTSDPTYDGIFYLGVKSTGIFCLPSCGARKPRPQNVEYFATPREAVFAGYRPCKRCRPLTALGQPPVWVGRLLTAVETDPSRRFPDAELRAMQIDPARVRRFFMKNYGMTFQAYCRGRRLGRAFEQIRNGASLDDAALGHGFESHSGFRDAFVRTFGVPPGKAGAAERITVAWVE